MVGGPGAYEELDLSPDGETVAVALGVPSGETDIWTIDLARGVPVRQTLDEARDFSPRWASNGRALVFSSERGGGAVHLYRKTLQGNAREEAFGSLEGLTVAAGNSTPDGTGLVCHVPRGESGESSHSVVVLRGDRAEPEPVMDTDYSIADPELSPDGRWMAYASRESGTYARVDQWW